MNKNSPSLHHARQLAAAVARLNRAEASGRTGEHEWRRDIENDRSRAADQPAIVFPSRGAK